MCLSCFVRILFCSSCLSAWRNIVVFKSQGLLCWRDRQLEEDVNLPGLCMLGAVWLWNVLDWCRFGWRWILLHWLCQFQCPRPNGRNHLHYWPLMWCSFCCSCALGQMLLPLHLQLWSGGKGCSSFSTFIEGTGKANWCDQVDWEQKTMSSSSWECGCINLKTKVAHLILFVKTPKSFEKINIWSTDIY